MPTMYTIEEHEAQQVKPYIDAKIGTVGNISGDPKTVSYADIVSIKDGIAVNAKDVSIKIEPVQAGSGTPSPSNVRAISGRSEVTVTRCGKNLVDLSVTESGGINSSGEYIGNENNTLWRMKLDAFINVLPNEKYSRRWTVVSQYQLTIFRVYYYDINRNFLYRQDFSASAGNEGTFTIPSNAYFIKWTTYTEAGQVTQDIVESYQIQIEIGEAATAYEPYAGNDYTINLGGTIYGGTLDVTTGVLTIDRAIITLNGDSSESWSTGTTAETGKHLFAGTISGIKVPQTSSESVLLTCDQYPTLDSESIWRNNDGISVYTSGRIWVYDSSKAEETVTNWENYLSNNPLHVVYELATPQVIQLTPTQIRMLAGVNTVYANTGDTQVEYFNASVGNVGEVLGDMQEDVQGKIDLASLQTVVAASSDFADFQTRIANL